MGCIGVVVGLGQVMSGDTCCLHVGRNVSIQATTLASRAAPVAMAMVEVEAVWAEPPSSYAAAHVKDIYRSFNYPKVIKWSSGPRPSKNW